MDGHLDYSPEDPFEPGVELFLQEAPLGIEMDKEKLSRRHQTLGMSEGSNILHMEAIAA